MVAVFQCSDRTLCNNLKRGTQCGPWPAAIQSAAYEKRALFVYTACTLCIDILPSIENRACAAKITRFIVFRLRRRRLWYSLVYLIWPSAFRSPQTDAERMFEVAASISLIGFQLPAYAVGADVGYASAGVVDGNWLS